MSAPGWWRPVPRRRRTPRPAAEYGPGVHVLPVPDVPADTLPPSVAITVPAPPPPPSRPDPFLTERRGERPDPGLTAELARVSAERDALQDELDRVTGLQFPAWVNTGGCPCHHCTQETP